MWPLTLLRSVRAWVRGKRGVKSSKKAKGEKRGDSNVSDNDIGYIYEAVKDKVSTLRLHHRHFKSRYPLVKVFDDFVGSRTALLPLLLRRLLLPPSISLSLAPVAAINPRRTSFLSLGSPRRYIHTYPRCRSKGLTFTQPLFDDLVH